MLLFIYIFTHTYTHTLFSSYSVIPHTPLYPILRYIPYSDISLFL